MGVPEAAARIDPTVVRGLEYYTGPVFEAELLLDTLDERGQPVRFGSIRGQSPSRKFSRKSWTRCRRRPDVRASDSR